MSAARASRRIADGRTAAAACAVALAAGAVGAYPEGAPWGAANPDAEESCASCHYDFDARRDSPGLALRGLPAVARAGRDYALVLEFTDNDAVTAGFQVIAAADDAQPGRISAADAAGIETIGAAARSVRPVRVDGGARWQLAWQAPPAPAAAVTFYVAASAANDDNSPFGDRVHYRRYRVEVQAGE